MPGKIHKEDMWGGIYAEATLSADANSGFATSISKLPFDATNADYYGDYDTGNYEFTAPATGRYRVSGLIKVKSTTDGTNVVVDVHKNGSFAKIGAGATTGAATPIRLTVKADIDAQAGDTLSLYGKTDDSDADGINADSHVSYELFSRGKPW